MKVSMIVNDQARQSLLESCWKATLKKIIENGTKQDCIILYFDGKQPFHTTSTKEFEKELKKTDASKSIHFTIKVEDNIYDSMIELFYHNATLQMIRSIEEYRQVLLKEDKYVNCNIDWMAFTHIKSLSSQLYESIIKAKIDSEFKLFMKSPQYWESIYTTDELSHLRLYKCLPDSISSQSKENLIEAIFIGAALKGYEIICKRKD